MPQERKCAMSVFQVLDRILELSPCAAVQYRIKTILKQEVDSELFNAFYSSKWVELLKANQLDDGGFGRFHSRDSKKKQKFPTTEMAVDSIRLLGITRGNPLADKLCDYMEKLLKREIEWPTALRRINGTGRLSPCLWLLNYRDLVRIAWLIGMSSTAGMPF
jgi:hypothetical protein